MTHILEMIAAHETIIIFIIIILFALSMVRSLADNKKIKQKIERISNTKINHLVQIDETTFDIVLGNIKSMIQLYTMVKIKGNILAKQNASMNFFVSLDTPEAQELKSEILGLVYNDIPKHILDYLTYYMGESYLQVYIETEIINAIVGEAKRL